MAGVLLTEISEALVFEPCGREPRPFGSGARRTQVGLHRKESSEKYVSIYVVASIILKLKDGDQIFSRVDAE